MNEFISDKGSFRTAPATPGLLIIGLKYKCISKGSFPTPKHVKNFMI